MVADIDIDRTGSGVRIESEQVGPRGIAESLLGPGIQSECIAIESRRPRQIGDGYAHSDEAGNRHRPLTSREGAGPRAGPFWLDELDNHQDRRFVAHRAGAMSDPSLRILLRLLVAAKRHLARTHLDTCAVHRLNKPAAR